MNAAPEPAPAQLPLAPPEGLVVVNPQNLEAGKHYFVTLVETENNAVVPNDRPWWDFVSLREINAASVTYDRIKTLQTNAAGDNFWYTLDPVDNPDEDMDLTQPREAVVESTQGLADGQYFIFYMIPPPQPQQQQAGRRSRRLRRRRSTRRRRSSRRVSRH